MASGATFNTKVPSMSVTVPLEAFPFSTMVAPITGSPLSSLITPEITLVTSCCLLSSGDEMLLFPLFVIFQENTVVNHFKTYVRSTENM